MEDSQQYSRYITANDPPATLSDGAPSMGAQQPAATACRPISRSSDGHQFQRSTLGVGLPQQSPVFNSVLSGQGQSLFSGVYPSPSFPNMNNFPAGFNGYSDPPMWLSDVQGLVTSNNNVGLPLLESSSISRNQYSDKKVFCNPGRIGLENNGSCSPLPADLYKTSSKDYSSYQSKVSTSSTAESQSWFYSQGIIGYGNQQNIQQTGYKCNDQFPSCSISQTNVLSDANSNSTFDSSCYVSSAHNLSPNKQTAANQSILCEQTKLGYSVGDKEHLMKYPCILQKELTSVGSVGQTLNHHSEHSKQIQEHVNFVASTTTFSSNTGIHDHLIYSHIPHILNISNDDSHSIRKPTSQTQNNVGVQQTVLQQHFHDPGVQCESSENCLQANKHSNSIDNRNVVERHSCSISAYEDQSSFSSNSMTTRPSLQCFSKICTNPLNTVQYCPNNITQFEQDLKRKPMLINDSTTVHLTYTTDSIKEVLNDDSESVAGESDIVVEETEDDSDSDISIEEIDKHDMSARCCVCDVTATSRSTNFKLVRISENTPAMSRSQLPIIKRLAEVLLNKNVVKQFSNHSDLLCQVCLNLIDKIDHLESDLALMKDALMKRYVPRIEPNDEAQMEERASVKMSSHHDQHNQQEIVIGKIDTHMVESVMHPVSSEKIDEEMNDNNQNLENTDQPTSLKKYQCHTCSKYFSSKSYLGKHQQQHTKSFSFYCDRCGRGFTMRRGLDNHLLLHSGNMKYQCHICGKMFVQSYKLEFHIQKHINQYRVSCEECGKGFMSSHALQIHSLIHRSGERPFICEHCGRNFSNNSNLVAHIKLCSGDRSFNCNDCSEFFALKTQLRRHILMRHDANQLSVISCTVCDKKFLKNSDCRVHMATHDKNRIKSHKCVVCGKCYTSLGNLNQHARMHNEKRQFNCKLCDGKSFSRRSALRDHMSVHVGLRNFKCKLCEKTFVTQRNLQAHQKWHAGTLKHYTCSICGKMVKHGLQVHMRSHSGLKPYKCPNSDCSIAFTVKSSLNKHIKTKHP